MRRFITLSILAVALALSLGAAPASAADIDADTQNVSSFNAFDGAGNEIPATSGGTFAVTYDTAAYGFQAGEQNRIGCSTPGGIHYGSRTAWVRFVAGVRGRLRVSATGAYDVQLYSFLMTRRRGESAFDVNALKTDNCNDATAGPNELNMPVPSTSAQTTERLQPGQTALIATASRCPGNAQCTDAAGGPTELSVTFTPDDADRDAVPDTLDDCPSAAGTAALRGCPDGDGDGVRDADDACPDKVGAASLGGCPDRDLDGIRDISDDCPDDAGPAAYAGCPDGDGDTVRDRDDDCPRETGSPQNRGCLLDGDRDGVPDLRDACPTDRGILADGCPDGDGDGVRDADDRCPTPGPASNAGCPVDSDRDGVPDTTDKCRLIPGNGRDGCPLRLFVLFPYAYDRTRAGTVLTKLQLKAPRGARVRMRCVARCRLKGGKRQLLAKVPRNGQVNLLRSLPRFFRPGARLEVRVTASRSIGARRVIRFGVPGADPVVRDACVDAGGRTVRCLA